MYEFKSLHSNSLLFRSSVLEHFFWHWPFSYKWKWPFIFFQSSLSTVESVVGEIINASGKESIRVRFSVLPQLVNRMNGIHNGTQFIDNHCTHTKCCFSQKCTKLFTTSRYTNSSFNYDDYVVQMFCYFIPLFIFCRFFNTNIFKILTKKRSSNWYFVAKKPLWPLWLFRFFLQM